MGTCARTIAATAAILAMTGGTAQAVVTESNVTTPSDGTSAFANGDAVVPETFSYAGTSDGTTGDVVDVICGYDGFSWVSVGSDVPVAADGSFSGTGILMMLEDNVCRLRAVPDDSNLVGVHRFTGPRMFVSVYRRSGVISGGPNDGLVTSWDVTVNGTDGYLELRSLAEQGIDDGAMWGLPTYDDEAGAWDPGARADAYTGDDLRASIEVDGNAAFGPFAAFDLFPGSQDNAGLQPSTFSVSRNAANGEVTVAESAAIVRCPTNTIPATALSCPSYLPTGVRWERTHVVREGGLQDEITDRLVSADGVAHTVDALFSNDFDESETGWHLAPDFKLSRYNAGDVLAKAELPNGPWTIAAHESDDEPDNSLEGGAGAITFDTQPESLIWRSDDRHEAQYRVTVPAGGAAQIRTVYSQAIELDHVIDLGRRAEDRLSDPQTTIKKKPKKRSNARSAKFTFGSSDQNSRFQCKLDGGKFKKCKKSRMFRGLAKGKHTLRVRAINEFGRRDSSPAKHSWTVKR